MKILNWLIFAWVYAIVSKNILSSDVKIEKPMRTGYTLTLVANSNGTNTNY